MKTGIRVAVYGQHCAISEQVITGTHTLSNWARATGVTLFPRYSPSGRRLNHRGSCTWELRDTKGKKTAGGTVSTIRSR